MKINETALDDMNFKKTTLLYFSPTATTRIVLEEITKGMGNTVPTAIDITSPKIRAQAPPELGDDLVVIGAPVYGGRLPKDAANYFKTIRASGSLAVLNEHGIALNRPNETDRKKAFLFGKRIADFLSPNETSTDLPYIDVPGNFPYKKRMSLGPFQFIDVTDDCDGCGICLTVCPPQARILNNSPIREKAKLLSKACARRKEPQTFCLPD